MAQSVFRKVAGITMSELKALRDKGLRPGIKALLYHPLSCDVLLGRLPSGYPKRFNLPGGGIDRGQSARMALFRELFEEIDGPLFTKHFLQEQPVVAEGYLPFQRENFAGKYEFIVAVPSINLDDFTVKSESKLDLFPKMHWRDAGKLVREDKDCGDEMRSLYTRSVETIQELVP